jgi:hypothetical protein
MGLTIHYSIEANRDWTRRQIRQKLEETRRFALSLPVVSVSEVAEFRGNECDVRNSEREGETADEAADRDPFRWAKIQAGRYVESPWRPGESRKQAPTHMMLLTIDPAEGSEPMNVGCCTYPRFVWKPERNHLPRWSNLFRGATFRESEKLLRAFLQKYNLAKMQDRQGSYGRHHGHSELLHHTPGGSVSIRSGRYLSHRKGYGPNFVELRLDDYSSYRLCFRFRGTIDQARTLFTGGPFKADLKDIMHGKEHVIPAEHGLWASFCKTQFASDPRNGGWANFQVAHLSVLAILEEMQNLGFQVEVDDESDFWKHRDLTLLARAIGERSEQTDAGAFKIESLAGHLQELHAAIAPLATVLA